MVAETAIKESAPHRTLDNTTITWTGSTAKVKLNNNTTVIFEFTDITEVKQEEDDTAVRRGNNRPFFTKTFATKQDAENAIKALALNRTLDNTTIIWKLAWNEPSETIVTLNSGETVTFKFTDITELKTEDDNAIRAMANDSNLLNATYETLDDARRAVIFYAKNGTYAEKGGFGWGNMTLTLTLHDGDKVEFKFTDITGQKKRLDDNRIKATANNNPSFSSATYPTKQDAENAIIALATYGTINSTSISWNGNTATVTLNDGTTVEFVFNNILNI